MNFPFASLDFPKSGNGGLCVKLVVIDAIDDAGNTLAMCCGASVFDFRQEPLVGDDQRPVPADVIPEVFPLEDAQHFMEEDERLQTEWIRFHYPRYGTEDPESEWSRHYRASVILGTTGWTGYSPEKGNWFATLEDLTDDGKALYRLMEKLNPGCPVHILTFLDT